MSTKEKDKASEDTLAKVPKKIVHLSGRFKDLVKMTNTGVAEADPNTYGELLKEINPDLTVDGAKQYQDADRLITAATRLGFGEMAIEFMKEHPNIPQASVEFDGGHNHFGETVYREHKVADSKGNEVIHYGHSVSFYEASATESKVGLKAISTHLTKLAGKTLGKVEEA